MDERIYLKVKIKSLAVEAKIIRNEEKRCKSSSLREGLYRHRIDVVRKEARHTLLAYGFLRGLSYKDMEPNAKVAPDWNKVRKMVEKYGTHVPPFWWNAIKDWKAYDESVKNAKQHLVDILKLFDEWLLKAQECISKNAQGT